ncbi:MAG: hypothetical protein Ct9H300mP30_3570 [Methanobacteriota archaeon]|nr:MAG: hypothetical protein Ct9H300mP30_3570 [Euryarchaeota archaeon]
MVSYLASERRTDLRRMSHLNPLSAFPLIYYLESKVLEVQNLRLWCAARRSDSPTR